MSFEFVMVHK